MKFDSKIRKSILYKSGKFILIIIFLLLILSSMSIKSKEAFKTIGFRPYRVTSSDMEPKFYEDDLILVINKDNVKIKEDDIIVFKKNDETVISRIINFNEKNHAVSKGDNSEEISIVRPGDVIGKVSFKISKAGFIINYLSNIFVIIIEIFIFILLIFQLGKQN